MNNNALKIGGIVAVSIALLASGAAIGFVVGSNNAQAAAQGYYDPGGMMSSYGGMMYGDNGLMEQTWPGCMMSGSGQSQQTGDPLTLDEAVEAAETYIDEYGDGNLELAEVMQFDNHFYAQIREVDTGINAFEMLIDPYTGSVYPEPGPNMMWNIKYGMMGGGFRGGMMGRQAGMMNGYSTNDLEDEMSVSPGEAREFAQAALDSSWPGTSVGEDVDEFYGYYTIHVLQDDETTGMLSVNGYSGQVWIHDWHGKFIAMTEHAHD